MLVKEQCMEIGILSKQGFSNRRIAKILGVSRNTVKKYLASQASYQYKPRSKTPTKLEPYHEYLKERVQAASPEWLPATVLLLEIKNKGYLGQISVLRDYLRTLKPLAKPDPIVRFETEPGEQIQIDWGEFKFGKLKLHAFVAILGYSRYCYAEFVENEKVETLITCHQNAFEFFGGISKIILYDNMKTVITKRNAYGEGNHKFQDQLWDYAKHMGFLPRLCKPYRAKTKGKVERFIGYLRRSFFNPLAAQFRQNGLILDRTAANNALRDWLDTIANARIHADLKLQPLALWNDIEKFNLQAIPPIYAGLKEIRAEKSSHCNPHSSLLPGYNADFLQHNINIYEQIQQLMS